MTAGRLDLSAELALSPDVGGKTVTVAVTGGLSITAAGVVAPLLDAEVLVDGPGLRLQVAPTVTLDLVRSAPGTPIRLYPAGAGLADVIGAAAESAVRVALNEVVGHRNDGTATPLRAVAGPCTSSARAWTCSWPTSSPTARIAAFITPSPAAYLEGHLAGVVTAGVQALADALDPTHALVQVAPVAGGVRRITFGTVTPDPPRPRRHDAVAHDRRRRHAARPRRQPHRPRRPRGPHPLAAGRAGRRARRPVRHPGRAGGAAADRRHPGRVHRDRFHPPRRGRGRPRRGRRAVGRGPLRADRRRRGRSDPRRRRRDRRRPDPGRRAPRVLGIALDLASSVLTEQLGTVVTDRATGMLQGVVFTGGGRQIDTTLFGDFEHPERLLHRLQVLLWNCATDPAHGVSPVRPLGVTIDGAVKISLASEDLGGGQKQIGLNVTPGGRLRLPDLGSQRRPAGRRVLDRRRRPARPVDLRRSRARGSTTS